MLEMAGKWDVCQGEVKMPHRTVLGERSLWGQGPGGRDAQAPGSSENVITYCRFYT